uniref:Uncharacterized protein n=1 Tax=viral metagenome TaxID=1070528 RepID=A0A6C0JG86_9ZZZZ
MSLATFKKKTINRYSSATKISGKPPGGVFLPQGPFGGARDFLSIALNSPGVEGFSLNGPHRNVGYVGKTYRFSKNGTPFRGIFPRGSGSRLGTLRGASEYNKLTQPVYNVNEVIVLGDQNFYVKPTVLSNFAMLRKKYKWAYYGQYPNYWVQPNYGGTTQSDTKSQGNYLHDLTVANTCVEDINNNDKYVGYIRNGSGMTCHTTPALFRFNDVARNSVYTKRLYQPLDASEQTMRIQRKCAHPTGKQKPFPYATSGSTCNHLQPYYVAPPEWYTSDSKGNNAQVN